MIYQLTNKNNIAQALARIEKKSDYITLLMNVCDYILSNSSNICEYYHYSPIVTDLIIRDFRIFIFYNESKYVSTFFPFRYSLSKNKLYYGSMDINRLTISHIRNIMDKVNDQDSFQNIEEKCNSGVCPSDNDFVNTSDFTLAKQLLEMEPGYVRYDHDSKNVNGRIHPLFHLDINYHLGSTYKIGLHDHISPARFFEIFDNNLEREYFENSKLHRKDKGKILHELLDSLKSNDNSNITN